MSKKSRLEKLEERLDLREKQRTIVRIRYAPGRDEKVDLEDFPYENEEGCESYQRQIEELEGRDPNNRVWIVTLNCKDCKEDCKFVGMVIGIGKGKNES